MEILLTREWVLVHVLSVMSLSEVEKDNLRRKLNEQKLSMILQTFRLLTEKDHSAILSKKEQNVLKLITSGIVTLKEYLKAQC